MPTKVENFTNYTSPLQSNAPWAAGDMGGKDWLVAGATFRIKQDVDTDPPIGNAKHPTFFSGFTTNDAWAVRIRTIYWHFSVGNYSYMIYSIGGPIAGSGRAVIFGPYPAPTGGAATVDNEVELQWLSPDGGTPNPVNPAGYAGARITFPWNEWVDFVVRHNGSGVLTFYVNGALQFTLDNGGALNLDDGSLEVFAENNTSGGTDAFWCDDYIRAYTAVPSAPTSLSATAAGATSINLTWTDAANSDFVIVQRSPAGAGTWTTLGTYPYVTAGTQAYSDTGLTPETEYDYRVLANNAMGNSSASTTASETTDAAGGNTAATLLALGILGDSVRC